MNETVKEELKEGAIVILQVLIGCILYSLGMNLFYDKAKLLAGGAAGIAQIVHYEFGTPVGLVVFLINIPLFIIGWFFVNRKFCIYSLIGMLIFSFTLSLFDGLTIPYESTLTSVVLGALLVGLGVGIIYRSGASVGGTDIINKILHKYFAVNMATSGLILNCIIVCVSALIYGLDQAVLTVAAMFIASKVTSFCIDGIDHRRVILIITDKKDELADALMDHLSRGVTEIDAHGAFTHKEHSLLYCVISKHQLPALKTTIKKTDPKAFFTIIMATGVYGNGNSFFSFQHIDS